MPRPLKVLLAEDNPRDVELTLRELRRAGFEPEWHQVDTEAAYLAQLHDGLDLVLSDFHMPQFTGFRALELLQQRGLEVPFILVSGTIGEDTAVEAMRRGATDYLLKDRLSRLGSAVTHALTENRLRGERRKAEEALRQKTALFEALLDSSIDGLRIVDLQGRKILQNRRFSELLKIPREIADGDDDEKTRLFVAGMVRHPEPFLARARHLYAHPEESSVEEIEMADGSVFDLHSSPILSKEGKNYGRIWAFRDITANKAAVLALRESEQRFKLVARAVSDVVRDWDFPSNTLWWSDDFQTTFGFAPGDIEPGIESWTNRIHPDERNRVMDSVHHAIDARTDAWSGEYRFQRKDGSYAFVQDRGYILRDPAGHATRMVGGMRDLTEQKNMEAQHLRTQRIESIGTLAGGIAHDLNNVLAPIMMSIELLKLDPANDPRRRRILETIQASSQRGADLVRQVLTFARGVKGERIALHLHHLAGELRSVISQTFPRNIRIESEVPGNLWPVIGDSSQLHQVLLNLTVNARDAMPNGGTLTLAAVNVALDAGFAATNREAKPGPYVRLSVTDTGQGIPPGVRDRIFEPFFTTKELGQGTGLGLATVHTIVKSHGGFVQVESEVGRGTTFHVYLPADPALGNSPPPHPLAPDLPRGHGELVLVVDDEFSIRHITQKTLQAFGYRVLTAGDGAAAVSLYTKHAGEIAVVLTDMMMPVMDGAATIRALRRINPAVRIISVSGLDGGGDASRTTSDDGQYFLAKPYSAEILLRLIRKVLDQPAVSV
ncbi:response regulator [Opitutus sp. GAS368]|uniref:hybrid sensor histidine kinase/response regulator n=1 Tax=Opitutus sp. GAS368 TaxID=1882749 RepID=UPI00087C24CA|nr:response regulator [Opitutus sp. GAS368]SDS16276.1 PAS/PAC sensor hybrid histidine kinase [Opitutus sp. GAS368]